MFLRIKKSIVALLVLVGALLVLWVVVLIRNNILLANIPFQTLAENALHQPEVPSNKITDGLYILKLALASTTARIEYSTTTKTVAGWRGGGEEIIINGGYFNADYTPSGFLVTEGKRVGSRMFDQDKSGLVVVSSGTLTIRDLGRQPIKTGEQFEGALQSYPFLIKDGKPAVATDSGLRARRTALGTDAAGNVYIFSLTTAGISLYEFAHQLVATGLPLTQALNLDGGPSAGIYAQWEGGEVVADSFTPISSIVRFTPRQ